MKRLLPCISTLALLALPSYAAVDADSPLLRGWYAAPMYSRVNPDSARRLDDGHGGQLALGYRTSRSFAVEVYGVYASLDRASHPGSAAMKGGGIGALAFLVDGLYLPFAVGHLEVDQQGMTADRYSGLSFETGLGYLFAVGMGRYDFAVRAEARYRHHNGQDGRLLDEKQSGQQDALFNLGLQLPLARAPLAPAAQPVRIVETPVVSDSDGDGVADDRDQCPRTPSGDAVDEAGCSLPPPQPPCGLPASGESRSLRGCEAGRAVVLHGVNFPSDRSALTEPAAVILDGVAAELLAHPQIRVEIGGHTDSQGADAYNQRLSEQRAESVRSHLMRRGVPAGQMTARGYGAKNPVAENDTDDGRARNRRVELTITDQGT